MAEDLASRRVWPPVTGKRITVVLPLREGTRDAVALLLEKGPPFDPGRAGLVRHEVYLSDDEAVFVFDATSPFALEQLVSDPNHWTSAAAWQDCLAGPPRIARPAYVWAATPEDRNDLFFDATPGPGDSEGGDVYSP